MGALDPHGSTRRHPGQQWPSSSLFARAAHLKSRVWPPARAERVIAPRRRCSAAVCLRDCTTYAPPRTLFEGRAPASRRQRRAFLDWSPRSVGHDIKTPAQSCPVDRPTLWASCARVWSYGPRQELTATARQATLHDNLGRRTKGDKNGNVPLFILIQM
ncbi:hypothetical protein LXA43DRAFT_1069501 [Ganoderma leucocontextum]|nr:hypothetical protein LXA43DRAFT_1069501 [Ganoderma leucocontextum]